MKRNLTKLINQYEKENTKTTARNSLYYSDLEQLETISGGDLLKMFHNVFKVAFVLGKRAGKLEG